MQQIVQADSSCKPDPRLAFLERASARLTLVEACEMEIEEACDGLADRYISREGGEPTNAERKAKAAGLTVIDGDKVEPKPGASVLDKTYAFIGRFVAYPSDHARVAHSYGLLTRMLLSI